MEPKSPLPNATAVFVMGICSLVFVVGSFNAFIFFGGISLILGIIGLSLASKGRKMYAENPVLYRGFGLLNAGFIMSILGTVLGSVGLLYRLLRILGIHLY